MTLLSIGLGILIVLLIALVVSGKLNMPDLSGLFGGGSGQGKKALVLGLIVLAVIIVGTILYFSFGWLSSKATALTSIPFSLTTLLIVGGIVIAVVLFMVTNSGGAIWKRLDTLIGIAIVAGGLLVFYNWMKVDSSCAANPGLVRMKEGGTSVYMNRCWDQVYLDTTGARQYDVRFADESSPATAGRSPYDFITIVTSFPGQTAETLKVLPNRKAFEQSGLREVQLVFIPTISRTPREPSKEEPPAPGRGLDFFSQPAT